MVVDSMKYIHFLYCYIAFVLIFFSFSMELYTPNNLKSPSIHTPISHLRSLEGKERKEFMIENKENILYFIKKVQHNRRKIQRKLDNYPEYQFGGNMLVLTSAIMILSCGNQIIQETQKTTENSFRIPGIIIGIIAGLGFGYFGIKKIHQNSPTTFNTILNKNNEVLYWLQHNGYYNEKEY